VHGAGKLTITSGVRNGQNRVSGSLTAGTIILKEGRMEDWQPSKKSRKTRIGPDKEWTKYTFVKSFSVSGRDIRMTVQSGDPDSPPPEDGDGALDALFFGVFRVAISSGQFIYTLNPPGEDQVWREGDRPITVAKNTGPQHRERSRIITG